MPVKTLKTAANKAFDATLDTATATVRVAGSAAEYTASTAGRAFDATVDATVDAASATARAAGTAAEFSANAAGTGITYTLDAIDYVDNSIDRVDRGLEDAFKAAGRTTAGIFGEAAKPHGERVGALAYRASKFALSFVPMKDTFRQGVDFIRHLRR